MRFSHHHIGLIVSALWLSQVSGTIDVEVPATSQDIDRRPSDDWFRSPVDPAEDCGGDFLWSNSTSAYFSYTFTGIAIYLTLVRFPYGTKVSITLDGAEVDEVNTYFAGPDCNTFIWSQLDLSFGPHTIRVRDSGGNPARWIESFGFRYTTYGSDELSASSASVAAASLSAASVEASASLAVSAASVSAASVAASASAASGASSTKNAATIGGAIGGSLAVIALFVGGFFLWRKWRRSSNTSVTEMGETAARNPPDAEKYYPQGGGLASPPNTYSADMSHIQWQASPRPPSQQVTPQMSPTLWDSSPPYDPTPTFYPPGVGHALANTQIPGRSAPMNRFSTDMSNTATEIQVKRGNQQQAPELY